MFSGDQSLAQHLVTSKTSEARAVQPLRFMACEGTKWERLAKEIISKHRESGPAYDVTQKQYKEMKKVVGNVLGLPVRCSCEEHLSSMYAQITKRQKEPAVHNKRKSANSSTQSGERKKRQKKDE